MVDYLLLRLAVISILNKKEGLKKKTISLTRCFPRSLIITCICIVVVNPSIKINYIVHGFFRIKAIELISVFIGVV